MVDLLGKLFKEDKTIEKTFLVFNTACFGDVLLCNSLCQNIKSLYPKSKIVFIVDKPFLEVAKIQKDVDEVVIYDKKGEHKGFKGMLKFVREFKHKKPYASFITYRNVRNVFVSHLLGSKHVVQGEKYKKPLSTQIKHNLLLKKITSQDIKNYPIKCKVNSELSPNFKEILLPENKYIGLCTISKKSSKDMPIETAIDFIKSINKDNQYKIVCLGVGDKQKQYVENLKENGCELVDLVNKTTIYELAQVIKNCTAIISVDTGTMHLSYSLDVPTIAVFYEDEKIEDWSPDSNLYNIRVLNSTTNAEILYEELKNFVK